MKKQYSWQQILVFVVAAYMFIRITMIILALLLLFILGEDAKPIVEKFMTQA